jgi:phosphatidylglycerophosphate synthase
MAVAVPPQRSKQPRRTRLGSNRDPFLDAIVLASVLLFMFIAAGVGVLILQQAFNK